MRSLLRAVLSISTFGIILSSCVDTGIDGEIYLGGKIDNPSDSVIFIFKQPDPVSAFFGEKPHPYDTITADAKGLFLSGTEYDSGMYLFRYHNIEFPFYMLPGKKLNINFNSQKPAESPTFSGSMKHPNRLLRDSELTENKIDERADDLLNAAPEKYLSFLDSARRTSDSSLVRFITDHPRFDRGFMEYRQQYNFYKTADLLLRYAEKRKASPDTDTVPDGIREALNSFSINNDNATQNEQYLAYVYRRVREVIRDRNPNFDITASAATTFNMIDSLLTAPKTKSYVGYRFALEYSASFGSFPPDSVLTGINRVITDYQTRKLWNAESEGYAKLTAGVTAPQFEAEAAGEDLDIVALRGKPLLLYMGLYGCISCKDEWETLKKIEEKYGDNITIAEIDLGRREQLSTDEFPGFKIKPKKLDIFVETYKIKKLPRYILISSKGNIIDANLKAPIEGKIKEIIEEAGTNEPS